ncbi:hypothetical protein, partial [Aquibium oceanicum]|uniref:hypothetical protein n=1 Tax=Aquibium oceanicum TaxID=1670800 RepID=UPI003612DD38
MSLTSYRAAPPRVKDIGVLPAGGQPGLFLVPAPVRSFEGRRPGRVAFAWLRSPGIGCLAN